MKKTFLFLGIIGTCFLSHSCEKDEDLTVDIVGDYVGAYTSNATGNINPYEIIVTGIDDDEVMISPKNGTEFAAFEITLVRSNSSTIISDTEENQQLDVSAIFTVGAPIGLTLSIGPLNAASAFVGVKQ